MTFRQEEYVLIFMWKTTRLHMQLWAKFHRGQLLMMLVVGLMPVRLWLLHKTGKGKQSQSFKMTLILMWMPLHPFLISVYLSFKICHPVSRATFFILPQIELIFSAKVSFSFSTTTNAPSSCFDILDHPLSPHLTWQSYKQELFTFPVNTWMCPCQ